MYFTNQSILDNHEWQCDTWINFVILMSCLEAKYSWGADSYRISVYKFGVKSASNVARVQHHGQHLGAIWPIPGHWAGWQFWPSGHMKQVTWRLKTQTGLSEEITTKLRRLVLDIAISYKCLRTKNMYPSSLPAFNLAKLDRIVQMHKLYWH